MAKLNPSIQHTDYVKYSPKWSKCQDVINGEDDVHAGGETYLPMLKEQSQKDYASYVMRSTFYNATARTIDGLVGMIFRKEPIVNATSALNNLLLDMTLTNCKFNEFAENITREILSLGRMGVLVEYPQIELSAMTLAQTSALNLRPYATTYSAKSIINWREVRINNVMQPVMIALNEDISVYSSEFEYKSIAQIRALLLYDGVYLQRVYRKNDKGEWLQIGNDIVPMMNGKPLSYIPFVFFGSNGNNAEINMPPLYDLVTLNLSHYRTTADYEHGCHFTGLPTAVISGYQAETGEKLSIGSSTAWIFPHPEASASYLEFTGQGLGSLENNLKAKEQMMASLGARMLAVEKSGIEAYGTVKLRQSGESAVLASIANLVKLGLNRVLKIMAEWSGSAGEVSVELNTDFADTGLSAQELTALVASWQGGAMSSETLHWNLKQGELIPSDRTYEQEQELIAIQNPQLGAL